MPAIEERARDNGFLIVEEYSGSALGLLALGLGQADEAIRQFERVRAWKEAAGQMEPVIFSWAADLVDAYLLAGDRASAIQALERLRARSLITQRPWAVASVARLDAALADEASYPAAFERALKLFERTEAPFDRARAQLAYGQRLRRSKRAVDARTQLDRRCASSTVWVRCRGRRGSPRTADGRRHPSGASNLRGRRPYSAGATGR